MKYLGSSVVTVGAAVMAAALFTACGDGEVKVDATTRIDSPRPIDSRMIDAMPVSVDASLMVCFSNHDCVASEVCSDTGNNMPKCVTGQRGTGVAGSVCTNEGDCASALCVEGPNVNELLCSDLCTDATMCPTNLPRCLGSLGICARNPGA
jgi:hypothetical protein